MNFSKFFFEVMFESDHSHIFVEILSMHILREHALKYPSQHIFFLFFEGGNNVKNNKNRACNTAHRYGELLPIAYFGTQLYCIFAYAYDFKQLSPGCFFFTLFPPFKK